MRNLSRTILLLLLLCWAASPLHANSSNSSLTTVGAPPGFDDLARPRELLVDVYFGGRKVGEAMIVSRPGFVRFQDPASLLELVPNAIPSPDLSAALAQDLPANSALVCSQTNRDRCGKLSPDLVGIVFDEEQFRVDVFLNPGLLREVRPEIETHLVPPTAPLSLTSSFGLALSGTGSTSPSYNLQARTIVGYRNARVRTNTSFASRLGLIVDDLVAEADWRGLRSSAGLFWAPGLDLTGRRRMVGAGIATQFDTRADRDQLHGTPLVLFLQQPARVEVLVDGRLVASQPYEAGNNLLDTSGLPDGSYSLVLRIHELGGAVREERRFFAKYAQVPPPGEPIYFAFAGVLADTRPNRPISLTDTFYYQLGTARRLNQSVAFDLSAIGTQEKSMAEAGLWLITRHARVRAAGLVSTAGDRGALLQVGSAGRGKLSFNFDLRRIWSRDGRPLIPLPSYVDNFGSSPPTGAQVGNGSYTQASGSVAYGLGPAHLSLTGSFRKDKGLPSDYSIGPSVIWPIINRGGLQLTLQGDVQRTRNTTASFLGLRLLFTSRGFSTMSTTGRASRRSRDGSGSAERMVTSVTGQYFHESADRTQVSLGAGFDRSLDSTTVHAGGVAHGRYGSLRGDIRHNLEGRGGTQYGLTLQSGALVSGNAVDLGGRDLEESAIIASVEGDSEGSTFEVLIDELPRGRIRSGARLPVFLQPYRSYDIRLRPVDSAPVTYDSATRKVTLYPGNVEHLRWRADSFFTIFGQAVRPDGAPVANASIRSGRGIGQTDRDGFFQVDVTRNDLLAFSGDAVGSCEVSLSGVTPHNDYASVGKVICR